MSSSRVRFAACLLAMIGVAQAADAQQQAMQPAGQGTAGQVPIQAGAAAQYPNRSGAAGVSYGNLNSPQPLPPLSGPPNQELSNYNAAVDAVSPLTADQIRTLRKRVDQAKRAANTSPSQPAKPVYSVQTVDLSPGAPPPIVRVSDLGSAVSFVDSAGQPWDIVEVNNLAKDRFDVVHPVKGVPTITITADGTYVEGDVAVFLKGLSFPVVLKMIAGQRETDYRLDVRIPRRGPNAVQPTRSEPSIGLPDDAMQSVLDGTQTAHDATPVHIENPPAGMTAWAAGDHILLRTNLFLNNPAYFGSVSGADGTHVYDIPRTPVVTVTENGASRNVILDLE